MELKILKIIFFTMIFIVISLSVVLYKGDRRYFKALEENSQVLPIKIDGPNGKIHTGIREVKIFTKDERDTYFWDEKGNLLERLYAKRNEENQFEEEIITYTPKRTEIIGGKRFTVQDVRGALFFTKGKSMFGNKSYEPGERVVLLEGKNIIAEYFRKRTSDSGNNDISRVIIYKKGRQAGVYILGKKPESFEMSNSDNNYFVQFIPPTTKLTEILKRNK